MGMLRIRCGYCNQAWDVYARSDYYGHVTRTCPHCGSKIDGQTWENKIIPAYLAMCEANEELMSNHTNYKQPVFTVDFIEDNYFPNPAADITANIEDLANKIEELKEAVDDLSLYQ